MQALTHTNGHVGQALEILFCKYFRIEKSEKKGHLENIDECDMLQRRTEEKEALESIYGEMFIEKIKNQIWIVKLKLDYLLDKKATAKEPDKPKTTQKEICRLFLNGNCRFGARCRFSHEKPLNDRAMKTKSLENDPYFLLEIRFPEGNFRIKKQGIYLTGKPGKGQEFCSLKSF